MPCPELPVLLRYREGANDAPSSHDVASHIAQCSPCTSLLKELAEQDELLGELQRLDARPQTPAASGLPERLGNFRVIREIGRGGMGIVLLAEQERPRRLVALKIMRPFRFAREDTRRFLLEAQMLGQLDHPNVARVYEVGVADIRGETTPFFAMEFVEGVTLDRWLSETQPTLDRRLDMFLLICEAMAHAHRCGVLHRDLKPANILVDASGRPRVIDFGLARSLGEGVGASSGHTESGRILGTLSHMAPEVAMGGGASADERADVYSLGVVFYRMLTGQMPIDLQGLALPQAIQQISHQEPPPPSRVVGGLPRGFDWVLTAALEKQPGRRYPTVAALARDLRSLRANEPLSVGPRSLLLQWKLLALRHTLAASVLIATLAGLILTAIGTTYGLLRERDARARTVAEAQAKERTLEFIERVFSSADPRIAMGNRDAFDELVEKHAADILPMFAADPQAADRLSRLFGGILRATDRVAPARSLLEFVYQRRRAEPGHADDPVFVSTATELARLDVTEGRPRDAIDRLEPIVERSWQRSRTDPVAGLADVHEDAAFELARLLYADGEVDRGLRFAEHAFQSMKAREPAGSERLAAGYASYGEILQLVGKIEPARDLFEQALAIFELSGHADHPTAIACRATLGSAAVTLRDFDTASQLVNAEELARAERVFGRQHPSYIKTMLGLALLLWKKDQHEATDPYAHEVLAAVAARPVDDSTRTMALVTLAECWLDDPRYLRAYQEDIVPLLTGDAARLSIMDRISVERVLGQGELVAGDVTSGIARLRAAHELAKSAHRSQDTVRAQIACDLSNALERAGDAAAGLVVIDEELAALDTDELASGFNGMSLTMLRGFRLLTLGRNEEAVTALDDGIALARRRFGNALDHLTLEALYSLAAAHFRLGNLAAAEDSFETAMSHWPEVDAGKSPDMLKARVGLAVVRAKLGKHVESERLFRESIEQSDQWFGENSAKSCYYRLRYAQVLVELEPPRRFEEARGLLREAIANAPADWQNARSAQELLASITTTPSTDGTNDQ